MKKLKSEEKLEKTSPKGNSNKKKVPFSSIASIFNINNLSLSLKIKPNTSSSSTSPCFR